MNAKTKIDQGKALRGLVKLAIYTFTEMGEASDVEQRMLLETFASADNLKRASYYTISCFEQDVANALMGSEETYQNRKDAERVEAKQLAGELVAATFNLSDKTIDEVAPYAVKAIHEAQAKGSKASAPKGSKASAPKASASKGSKASASKALTEPKRGRGRPRKDAATSPQAGPVEPPKRGRGRPRKDAQPVQQVLPGEVEHDDEQGDEGADD